MILVPNVAKMASTTISAIVTLVLGSCNVMCRCFYPKHLRLCNQILLLMISFVHVTMGLDTTKEKHGYTSSDIGVCIAKGVNTISRNWSVRIDKQADVMSNSWPDWKISIR